MSSVRMCDKCRTIFSENDEGWQTATLNTVQYDDDGMQKAVPIRQDLCPDCAIPSPNRRKSKQAELESRIANLESQNEELDKLTAKIEAVGSTAKGGM